MPNLMDHASPLYPCLHVSYVEEMRREAAGGGWKGAREPGSVEKRFRGLKGAGHILLG